MKKFFLFAALAGVAFFGTSCSEDEPTPDTVIELKLDASSKEVAFDAGTATISVTANAEWAAVETADWVTISPDKGTGNGTVTVTYDANTAGEDREAKIDFATTTGNKTASFTLKQTFEPKPTFGTEQEQATLSNYADDIVVANYTTLATDGKNLLNAVKAIAASTDADKTALIKTAADAWVVARIAWERTEAYLFGPVDKAGIDPGIDSWPLVLPDLQSSIQVWNTATDNYESLKNDGGDLKGFHAIEYLLFMDGAAKTTSVATFNEKWAIEPGELTADVFEDKMESYLVAVTEELYRCVLQLEAEWNMAGLSAEKKADFDAFGANITLNTPAGNYAELFKTPGLDNAFYNSFAASVEEAFLGAIGIADEVGNVKIADPINAETEEAGTGLLEVESWFSFNSISDFTNNVRGIKEAYFGKRCGDDLAEFDADTTPAESSIGAYVAFMNEEANANAVAAINKAIEAAKAMPAPFRDNLSWGPENQAAQAAIGEMQSALEAAQAALAE